LVELLNNKMEIKASQLSSVKLMLLVIASLVAGNFLSIFDFAHIFAVASVILLTILLYLSKRYSLAFYSGSIAIGLLLAFNIYNLPIKAPDKILSDQKAIIKAEVIRVLKQEQKYSRYLIRGDIDTKFLPKLQNRKTLLTVFHSDSNYLLNVGDIIYTSATVKLPKERNLPNEFNEKLYLANMGASFYATTSATKISIMDSRKSINYYRSKILHSLSEKINLLYSPERRGIIKAMLTGEKSEIDPETRQLFSYSGTAHILAVSGFHVAIISFLIYTLLGFVSNRYLKFILFSMAVIGFVILTGIQPSALRAGSMAILLVFIKTMQRQVYPLNIVSFVILIIVVFRPELIYSISFQMSASAIFGIVLFFRMFEQTMIDLFNVKSTLSNYAVKSLAMTFSASLVTVPLVAYYFNVFSVVSPLSNLFVIPLMSLVLIFSVFALIFSFVWYDIAQIYSSSAEMMLDLSIMINQAAVELPYSYFEGDLALWLALLISPAFAYILLSKNHRAMLFRLSAAIIIVALGLQFVSLNQTEKSIAIYPRNQFTAIEVPGEDHTLFFILDRKPSIYPRNDFSFNKYLIEHTDSIRLAITGNAGINISDIVSKERAVDGLFISIDEQIALKDLLNLQKHPVQIIDINYANRYTHRRQFSQR